MTSNNLKYGIDLGTTNSAISESKQGITSIIKSLDNQKDTTPSCVSFNRKGSIMVGDSAFRRYRRNSQKLLSRSTELNAFIEFKRTMGTDEVYSAPNADKDYASQELSAEVLKKLKSYVQEEKLHAAVITVPSAFKVNQIDATREAGRLAGLRQVETMQEPVAAAMAYGIETQKKNGYWVIFDFGGGTFDSALLKVEEGVIQVKDIQGDNHLGRKNLDYAIVDEILIPHIQENYAIEKTLNDSTKRSKLISTLKFYAEEIKNRLSSREDYDLYVYPGEMGFDDKEEEIEIDIVVDRNMLRRSISPIFQKAVDITKQVLNRNNLKGEDLDSLMLVGSPTLSPIIREMLTEQITEPDTSVDPMTVVSRGAAIYASTIELDEEIADENMNTSKIQLDVNHEESSVEKYEHITIKLRKDKTEGNIPDRVYAEIQRGDNAWKSNKIEIDENGEIIEVSLDDETTNIFSISLTDDKGNSLDCEPINFIYEFERLKSEIEKSKRQITSLDSIGISIDQQNKLEESVNNIQTQLNRSHNDIYFIKLALKELKQVLNTVNLLKESYNGKSSISSILNLIVNYPELTTEKAEFITIQTRKNEVKGYDFEKLFVQVIRVDAWKSNKVEVDENGEIIEVQLRESQENVFLIILSDNDERIIQGHPASFTIYHRN